VKHCLRSTAVLLCAPLLSPAQTAAERLIEAGHWKRARAIVEDRLREAPGDAQSYFLLSQIRAAFGDRATPMQLAERAVALDGRIAKYHRQIAEVVGITAQHSMAVRQLFLARRFRKEIDTALSLDSRDVQAQRDLVEFYLLAPGIAGGDRAKAEATAAKIGAIDPAEGFLAEARVAEFEKRTADEEALLRRAAEARPPSYRAQIALAEFCLDSRHPNPQLAETAANSAIQVDSGRADAYAVLATLEVDRCSWDALDATLAESSRRVPDDLFPEYRAATRLIAARREPDRASRYLRAYLAQEPEGNRPTVAEATDLLKRVPR
jgi:hypothetical protein